MNEQSILYKAIEQAIIIPESKKLNEICEIDYEFSDHYRKKIKRLINNRNKSYYPLIKTNIRKVVCLIAAILLMGSITVAAYKPLRDWFVGLFAQYNEENVEVVAVQGDIDEEAVSENINIYEPTYIPEGYKLKIRSNDSCIYTVIYENNEGNIIEYTQSNLLAYYNIDTKKLTSEKIEINCCQALIVYNDEYSSLTWSDNNYTYYISGDISKSDIILIGNSLKMTK